MSQTVAWQGTVPWCPTACWLVEGQYAIASSRGRLKLWNSLAGWTPDIAVSQEVKLVGRNCTGKDEPGSCASGAALEK